jgi:D5-like protein
MIALARSEPGITISSKVLDANPMLLSVQNGTLDLRTGELRAPSVRTILQRWHQLRSIQMRSAHFGFRPRTAVQNRMTHRCFLPMGASLIGKAYCCKT